MPDRVREAMFASLGAHYDTLGALPELQVADVFAGGGSLGLEALSRGAAFCWFFERDRVAVDALHANIQALGAEAKSEVIIRDAWNAAVTTPEGRPFDLILLDPPYQDSDDSSAHGRVRHYLARLAEHADNHALVVLHHQKSTQYSLPAGDPWRIVDQRTFGSNSLTLFLS